MHLVRGLVILVLAGCGSHQTRSQPAPAAAPEAMAQAHRGCPMMAPAGARVAAVDTSDGAAIELTTSGDVVALRARAREMADMHDRMREMHAHGGMHGQGGQGMYGMHGQGGMHMHGPMHPQMMMASVRVDDIANGARVVFVPADPAQLAALRAEVHEHVAIMQRGDCPMTRMADRAP